jgi:hypothetical protein
MPPRAREEAVVGVQGRRRRIRGAPSPLRRPRVSLFPLFSLVVVAVAAAAAAAAFVGAPSLPPVSLVASAAAVGPERGKSLQSDRRVNQDVRGGRRAPEGDDEALELLAAAAAAAAAVGEPQPPEAPLLRRLEVLLPSVLVVLVVVADEIVEGTARMTVIVPPVMMTPRGAEVQQPRRRHRRRRRCSSRRGSRSGRGGARDFDRQLPPDVGDSRGIDRVRQGRERSEQAERRRVLVGERGQVEGGVDGVLEMKRFFLLLLRSSSI